MSKSSIFIAVGAFILGIIVIVTILLARQTVMIPEPGELPGDDVFIPTKTTFKCDNPTTGRSVIGQCADSAWEHFWNDLPYCSNQKFWCEFGGGTWTVLNKD